MPAGSRSRGHLEREVIACLAAADAPLTASEVLADLGRPLAYTTVLTTLTRLFEKHAVVRTPRGRAFAYSLRGGPDAAAADATAHQMHRLLASGADRAGVLASFVAELSEADEQVLNALLTRAEERR